MQKKIIPLECGFGGICLGNDGEIIKLVIIDSMNLDIIGFIFIVMGWWGSESFIFSYIRYDKNIGRLYYMKIIRVWSIFI